MKFLILVSSVLSVALASWEPVQEKYHGPLHYPKIHKGVPVEPAAVQHAREAHLQAVAEMSHNSYNQDYDDHQVDYDHHSSHHEEHQPKWHGALHYPVIHKGVPVEPTAVQHARAAHLQAVSGHAHHGSPAAGHPVDTHEVAEAKAKHMAAVNEALARNSHGIFHYYRKRRGAESYVHVSKVVDHHHGDHGYTIHQKHAPVYGHHDKHHQYDHEIPKIGHDGTPQDTIEVQHAKAAHFAAYHSIAQGHHH